MGGYELQGIQGSHLEVAIPKQRDQFLEKLLSLRFCRIWLNEVLLVAVLSKSLVLLAEADHQLPVHLAGVLGVDVEGDLRQVFPPSILLRGNVCGRKLSSNIGFQEKHTSDNNAHRSGSRIMWET